MLGAFPSVALAVIWAVVLAVAVVVADDGGGVDAAAAAVTEVAVCFHAELIHSLAIASEMKHAVHPDAFVALSVLIFPID